MTSQPATLKAFTDAAADAVARAIATVHRDAAREKELRDAEYRARMAELDTRLLSVSNLERTIATRLTELEDGAPGRDGDPGPPGERGNDGKDGLPGADGRDGTSGVDGKDGAPGRDGVDGAHGVNGKDGTDGAPGRDGDDGQPGERGADGAPGKLPIVRAWSGGVQYEGDVVFHAGATWQALRDSGREPPHGDWICIATAGRDGQDGRTPAIRGTWSETGEYRALDVVMLGGASFVAKVDDPGICPGEGWQLFAAQGKRGNPGERGAPGLKGDRGERGPSVVAASVDGDGMLTLTNADGSSVSCDFYPILTRLR